jgi:hypothetical protein
MALLSGQRLVRVLALETVMEFYCLKSPARLRVAAGIHAWGDRLIEGPLVILILITGALLLAERWPGTPILWLKIALGTGAALVNLYCIALTHKRLRDDADDAALSTWTRKVIQTGYAMPVGLLVFAMGVSMTNQ